MRMSFLRLYPPCASASTINVRSTSSKRKDARNSGGCSTFSVVTAKYQAYEELYTRDYTMSMIRVIKLLEYLTFKQSP
jgi:hypothetical protein